MGSAIGVGAHQQWSPKVDGNHRRPSAIENSNLHRRWVLIRRTENSNQNEEKEVVALEEAKPLFLHFNGGRADQRQADRKREEKDDGRGEKMEQIEDRRQLLATKGRRQEASFGDLNSYPVVLEEAKPLFLHSNFYFHRFRNSCGVGEGKNLCFSVALEEAKPLFLHFNGGQADRRQADRKREEKDDGRGEKMEQIGDRRQLLATKGRRQEASFGDLVFRFSLVSCLIKEEGKNSKM
ncbi:hypothetical protein LWI29_014371 [Acer saccharum]|uniref:Uncharacterized protein n=1 Tax=Acer saccharum TaxID=4024 RepID=A0AA39VGJ7_ACESA|nr:hypothetical protein LWI29_014371 [Acer saccharum]